MKQRAVVSAWSSLQGPEAVQSRAAGSEACNTGVGVGRRKGEMTRSHTDVSVPLGD